MASSWAWVSRCASSTFLNMAEGTVGPTTTAAKEKLRQIMTDRGGGHWEEETV